LLLCDVIDTKRGQILSAQDSWDGGAGTYSAVESFCLWQNMNFYFKTLGTNRASKMTKQFFQETKPAFAASESSE